MDINKLITESLSNIIDENTITDKTKEIVGDVAGKSKEIAGSVAGKSKEIASETKNLISENPKTSAAVAAALAAGLGAVAFRKKLAELMKKKSGQDIKSKKK